MYAGFGRRAAAYLIDVLIASALGFAASFILGIIYVAATGSVHGAGVIGQGLYTAVALVYFATMESSSRQATLGKELFGLMVTDEDGNRISFPRAAGRYAAKILSTLALLIGWLMPLWTKRKQALHDVVAGTLVVRREAEPARARTTFTDQPARL